MTDTMQQKTLESLPIECEKIDLLTCHEPSLLPSGKKFKLVWNDEFDGNALDTTKWSFRTHFWGKRFPCFADENDVDALEFKDSCIHLKLCEKNGRFYSPHLQTGALLYDGPLHAPEDKSFWPYSKRENPKYMHKYGYYECRARTQQLGGWWSAFWLQSPDVGATLNPIHSGIECDIMECFTPGYISPSCLHYNGYGQDYKGFKDDRGTGDIIARSTKLPKEEFHTFGCLWEPDGYTFYIDGRRKGFKVGNGGGNEAVSDTEQFILISTESHSYRNNGQPAEGLEKSVGDEYIVDYVRVFDCVD